jgi:hypothetical protein
VVLAGSFIARSKASSNALVLRSKASVYLSCLSLYASTSLFGVGSSGGGQPVHSGLVTLLGVVKVCFVYPVVDAGVMTYTAWESGPRYKWEQMVDGH